MVSGDTQGEGNIEKQDKEELLKNVINFLSKNSFTFTKAFLTGGHAFYLEIPFLFNSPINIPFSLNFSCPSGSSSPLPSLADFSLLNVNTNPPRSEEEEDKILRENILKRMQDAGLFSLGNKGYLRTPWSEILAY